MVKLHVGPTRLHLPGRRGMDLAGLENGRMWYGFVKLQIPECAASRTSTRLNSGWTSIREVAEVYSFPIRITNQHLHREKVRDGEPSE